MHDFFHLEQKNKKARQKRKKRKEMGIDYDANQFFGVIIPFEQVIELYESKNEFKGYKLRSFFPRTENFTYLPF